MLDHLDQFVRALVATRNLRTQIANILRDVSHRVRIVSEDVRQFVFEKHAFANQLHVVKQHTLFRDVLRERRHRAWGDAANVGMVTARSGVEQRRRFAFEKNRFHYRDVWDVRTARVRCVEHEGVARLHGSSAFLQNHPNAFAHGAQMHRHVRCVGDEVALWIKNRTGEIEALLDVDRVAGVGQRHAHLLGNRHEQIVENFKQHRVGCRANGVSAFGFFRAFEYEVILYCDDGTPLGLNYRGRNWLLDDGRASNHVAGTQVFAVKHLRWSQCVLAEYRHFSACVQAFKACR